jgi:Tfp pilus assembly protein PilF
MNLIHKITYIVLFITLSACSGIKSSLAYTEGTQCLDRKDYVNAINHLENAVALDPTLSRNHTNLCAAYMGVNNVPKAWEHARAAVLCKYKGDGSEDLNFIKFYNILIRHKLDQPGQSYSEITAQLGIPDSITMYDNTMIVTYGICDMTFESEKLTKCSVKLQVY